MSHYPMLFLPEGKNSMALYTTAKSEKLIVFVHGFRGSSLETWNEFSSIINNDPDFDKTDVLFYGYNSIKGQLHDQGVQLFRFLNRYIKRLPLNFFDPGRGIDYQRILISAHSQGAIVSRFALLEAVHERSDWRKITKLILFAPAHNGARIQNLVMLSLPAFAKVLGGLAMYRYAVLDDLKPNSVALEKLIAQTMAQKGGPDEPLMTAYTLEAYDDKVVHNGRFCYDDYDAQSPFAPSSHTTVCKPVNNRYMLPVEIIKSF